jgi:hypothetical protein
MWYIAEISVPVEVGGKNQVVYHGFQAKKDEEVIKQANEITARYHIKATLIRLDEIVAAVPPPKISYRAIFTCQTVFAQ